MICEACRPLIAQGFYQRTLPCAGPQIHGSDRQPLDRLLCEVLLSKLEELFFETLVSRHIRRHPKARPQSLGSNRVNAAGALPGLTKTTTKQDTLSPCHANTRVRQAQAWGLPEEPASSPEASERVRVTFACHNRDSNLCVGHLGALRAFYASSRCPAKRARAAVACAASRLGCGEPLASALFGVCAAACARQWENRSIPTFRKAQVPSGLSLCRL